MKKIIVMLFLVIGLGIVTNCSKEDEKTILSQTAEAKNIGYRNVEYSELKSNRKFVNSVKYAVDKHIPSIMARGDVLSNYFGVYIDTTKIAEVISGDEISLTMSILNYSVGSKVENLVLYAKAGGDFSSYIVRYKRSDIDAAIATGTEVKPCELLELETSQKMDACVTSFTHTSYYCHDANNNVISSEGNLGEACVGTGWSQTFQILEIDMSCAGGTGNPGPTIILTGSTVNNNTGVHTGNHIPTLNTVYIPCSNCPELSEEFSQFYSSLDAEQKNIWSTFLGFVNKRDITTYLSTQQYTTESQQLVSDILTAIIQLRFEGGDIPIIHNSANNFIKHTLFPESLPAVTIDSDSEGPDCESFNFVAAPGAGAYQAVLLNIHFNISIVNPAQLSTYTIPLSFPQATLFTVATYLASTNISITPGQAAHLSAMALHISMKETAAEFVSLPSTEMMARIFFRSRSIHNHRIVTLGGTVNFNATNYSVSPTQYNARMSGIGNCN